jgi:hypothetical protein
MRESLLRKSRAKEEKEASVAAERERCAKIADELGRESERLSLFMKGSRLNSEMGYIAACFDISNKIRSGE